MDRVRSAIERHEAHGSPVTWLTRRQYGDATVAEKALAWASTQDGVRETSTNSGREVDAYLRAAGLAGGHPWCAAFVAWCIKQAVGNYGPPYGKAAVNSWARWGEDRGMRHDRPKRGDLFYWVGRNGFGHIGFVTRVLPLGVFLTVEGNTNEEGSREGIGVLRRTRTVAQLKKHHRHGFIRLG